MPRTVPIPPVIRPLISKYITARERWLGEHGIESKALFVSQNVSNRGEHLSSNGIRNMKVYVGKEVGVKFDLRECRRTFGQKYLDKDIDIETVSVLMGHALTKTTEGYYCRRKLTKAIRSAENTWNKAPAGPEADVEGGDN